MNKKDNKNTISGIIGKVEPFSSDLLITLMYININIENIPKMYQDKVKLTTIFKIIPRAIAT